MRSDRFSIFIPSLLLPLPLLLLLSFEVIMKVDSQNNFVVSEISSISSISSSDAKKKNFLNRDLKTKARKNQKGNWKFLHNLINLSSQH